MTVPKRVLVVDDDDQVLRYLTELLQEAGHDTLSCSRFLDAKGLLTSAAPDVLVTDIRLGAYNGLQLAIFARDRHPDLPIIVLSGYEDPTLRAEASHSNALFLTKPVSRETLLAGLSKSIGGEA